MGNVTGGNSKAQYWNEKLQRIVMTTPLHKAATAGESNLVQWFVTRGAEIDGIDEKHRTPLHLCAQAGHEKCCQILLHAGASTGAVDIANSTPLHCAAKSRNLAVFLEVLKHSKDGAVSAVDNTGNNVLAYTLWSRAALRAALEKAKEEDIQHRNSAHYDLLHIAAREGYSADVMEELIRAGLSPNSRVPLTAPRNQNSTPLLFAVANDNVQCLLKLMEFDVDLTCENANGQCPLIIAAICDSVGCVRVLVQAGVNINAVDYKKKTALHYACESEFGNKAALALIRAGAGHSIADSAGMTPLHIAAAGYRIEVCRELVLVGADLTVDDGTGLSPMDYFRSKDPDICESMAMLNQFYRRRFLFMLWRRPGMVCDAAVPPGKKGAESKTGCTEDKENAPSNVPAAGLPLSGSVEMKKVVVAEGPAHPHLQLPPDEPNRFLNLPRAAVYKIAGYL